MTLLTLLDQLFLLSPLTSYEWGTEYTVAYALVSTLSLSNYWREQAEKNTGQDTTNPHIIAARIILRGGEITHNDINAVLASQGHSITAEELEELKSIDCNTYNFTVPILIISALKNIYLKKPKGEGQWGVYMWLNTTSGKYYVGSTQVLWERLAHYWKTHSAESLRKVLTDIRNTGLEYFLLDVYEFPDHLRELRFLLALEQYYLLSMNPSNNTLYVAAGSPGGMAVAESNRDLNSQKLYMYQDNILLYVFDSVRRGDTSFAKLLNSSNTTVNKCINNNLLFLGKFLLSHSMLMEANNSSTLSLVQVQALVLEARAEHGKTRATYTQRSTSAITVQRLSDNRLFHFDNYYLATVWYKSETGKVLQYTTLDRRLANGLPLNGYTFRLQST